MQTGRTVRSPRGGTQGRGDRQRDAIVAAVYELLAEQSSFAELSVSAISERAGIGRSGFYFYFDTKYSVLAQMFAEARDELDELTRHFAPRDPDESPEEFAHRMVASAAMVFVHSAPLMRACNQARHTDATIAGMLDDLIDGIIAQILTIAEVEVNERGARPVSADLPALVRTLTALTATTVSGDTSFVGRDADPARAIAIVETLWRTSLLGE